MTDIQARADRSPAKQWEGAVGKPALAYIDCLRGFAILMVIVTHTTYLFPELPYPVHRLGAFGWYGVQLFFLASCLTLMMSADYERARTGRMSSRNFFLRRFFRIAPMYYLAAGLYMIVAPTGNANPLQLLASLSFVNAWHPVTMTTTGDWQVVPGGWSIGVEFTFYFLFPLFFAWVSSARRAFLLLLAMLGLGVALNGYLMPNLAARYGSEAADNFLYFWFFNQAPVFVLGALTFFAIRATEMHPDWLLTQRLRRHAGAAVTGALLFILIVAMAPLPLTHNLMPVPVVPQFLAASCAFSLFVVTISQARHTILVNSLFAWIGKVSFSAYLLHFAVIQLVLEDHPEFFHLNAKSWSAIWAFGWDTALIVAITTFVSSLTYLGIEKPMMNWARMLTRKHAVAADKRPQPVIASS
jgi:peptidoglycan/LPS O-acetylase OafA/YrhL